MASDDEESSAESISNADEATLRAALDESQRAFDKQVTLMEASDDKATRTARLSVLILGVVTSAIAVGGPRAFQTIHVLPALFSVTGVSFLLASTVVGLGTDTMTTYPIGIGPDHREDAKTQRSDEWIATLLDEYDEWSEETGAVLEQNFAYLFFSQATLILGMLQLLAAAGMTILHNAYGINPFTQFGTVLILVGIGLLVTIIDSPWI